MKLDLIPFDPGSALPPVTSTDEGSALVVKKVYKPGAVIVPEQTCVYDEEINGTETSNPNSDLFVVGTKVIATLNGEKFGMGTVTESDDEVGAYIADVTYGIYFWKFNNKLLVNCYDLSADEPIPTYTCSLSVAEETYEYALDPYPGYDVVFKTTVTDTEQITAQNTTIEKGSWAEVFSLAKEGKVPRVKVIGEYIESESEFYVCEYNVFGTYFDVGYNDALRVFVTGGYSVNRSLATLYAPQTATGTNLLPRYAPNCYVTLLLTESGIRITHYPSLS